MTITVRQAALSMLVALMTAPLGCAAESDGDERDESVESAGSAAVASSSKVLSISYQVQETGYWCGPAATRHVISARSSNPPTQAQLARELPTDTEGTDYIGQVTRVLNKYIGNYITVEMPNDPPRPEQKNRLWNDITRSINGGYGVVANIVAPPWNHPPGYPNSTIYHYFAVIGYDASNANDLRVFIADSANFSGYKQYWLSFNQLATLIPPKGYSAWGGPQGTTCPGGNGTVIGAIEAKYKELGGCNAEIGIPTTEELPTANNDGRYTAFTNGTIYWTPALGAHEVRDAIFDRYAEMRWEMSILRYPTTDQIATSDGRGQKNVFQNGVIYWSEATGAHEVYGDIRAKYISLGEEKSQLGLPTSGEYGISGGRRNDFEGGSISWRASNRETTVTFNP